MVSCCVFFHLLDAVRMRRGQRAAIDLFFTPGHVRCPARHGVAVHDDGQIEMLSVAALDEQRDDALMERLPRNWTLQAGVDHLQRLRCGEDVHAILVQRIALSSATLSMAVLAVQPSVRIFCASGTAR